MHSKTETDMADTEGRDLRRIAGMMLPADAEFGVPGADDAAIFADIVRSLGRDFGPVRAALAALAERGFADADEARGQAMLLAFLAAGGPTVAALSRAVVQCYYRDDRVLLSLGLEARPPYPQGHTLDQGDWSLLDPVRGRAPLWRDDRGT